MESKIKDLESKTLESDFWHDVKNANNLVKTLDNLNKELLSIKNLEDRLENIEIMIELEESESSILDSINLLEKDILSMELKSLMTGEYDKNSAIVHIQAGAGGDDSEDWALILENMYIRWSNLKGYKLESIDRQSSEAGIKSSTVLISGDYAFGNLKCENGVHRLVRISPFNSNGKRHTSFASLHVSPEIESEDFEMDMSKIRVDTFRSSGAGGQHVNTTDSAVRVTDLDTNISVTCSSDRSQIKNREKALKILKSKLIELDSMKREEHIKSIGGEELPISWGNQIRSYVLHPYKLVKDHRTKLESSNIDDIFNGKIDNFIDAYLKTK